MSDKLFEGYEAEGPTYTDEKYVVFNRHDWEYSQSKDDLVPLKDAVVIRLQDVFAPPALDAYANAIETAIEIVQDILHEQVGIGTNELAQLRKVADHFHQAATASWQLHRKLPD